MPYPSYAALRDLIHGAWETHVTLKTDADGCITLEGFKGNYTLKTSRGNASLILKEDMKDTLTLSEQGGNP